MKISFFEWFDLAEGRIKSLRNQFGYTGHCKDSYKFIINDIDIVIGRLEAAKYELIRIYGGK